MAARSFRSSRVRAAMAMTELSMEVKAGIIGG